MFNKNFQDSSLDLNDQDVYDMAKKEVSLAALLIALREYPNALDALRKVAWNMKDVMTLRALSEEDASFLDISYVEKAIEECGWKGLLKASDILKE